MRAMRRAAGERLIDRASPTAVRGPRGPAAGGRVLRTVAQAAAGGPQRDGADKPLSRPAHRQPGPAPRPAADRPWSWRTDSSANSQAGGGGGGASGGGGGGDGGGGGGDDDEDEALTLEQAEAAAAASKAKLPADMADVARSLGLRSSALSKFLALRAGGVTGALVSRFPAVRDRMIADDRFLFKVVAECIIDTGCATVAEVRKRGDDFWAEFEFYLSDLLVGIVLDVVLVSLMAPRAVLGAKPASLAAAPALQRWLSKVPSAVFEASVPGVRTYAPAQRLACLGVKFLEYSLAGMCCGLVGQGVANGLMLAKRHIHGESEDDVPVPPLLRTALVWGLFMGVSSNARYQAVFGLERFVDMTIARRVPAVAYGTTVAIRFVNNVIGGENFIDMARWAGVQ